MTPSPVTLIHEISRHIDECELRVRQRELRDYDFAALRLHLSAAQSKLVGILDLLATR